MVTVRVVVAVHRSMRCTPALFVSRHEQVTSGVGAGLVCGDHVEVARAGARHGAVLGGTVGNRDLGEVGLDGTKGCDSSAITPLELLKGVMLSKGYRRQRRGACQRSVTRAMRDGVRIIGFRS